MTPEQRARLEDLKARQGDPVQPASAERPIHFAHAHYADSGTGMAQCACDFGCPYCPSRGEDILREHVRRFGTPTLDSLKNIRHGGPA